MSQKLLRFWRVYYLEQELQLPIWCVTAWVDYFECFPSNLEGYIFDLTQSISNDSPFQISFLSALTRVWPGHLYYPHADLWPSLNWEFFVQFKNESLTNFELGTLESWGCQIARPFSAPVICTPAKAKDYRKGTKNHSKSQPEKNPTQCCQKDWMWMDMGGYPFDPSIQ